MGCTSPREKLEDEMMVYKLERMQIQMEKEKELKKLAEIEGKCIKRSKVPDYIDPVFAKEKKLYEDHIYDDVSSKKKGNKKNENPRKKKKIKN